LYKAVSRERVMPYVKKLELAQLHRPLFRKKQKITDVFGAQELSSRDANHLNAQMSRERGDYAYIPES